MCVVLPTEYNLVELPAYPTIVVSLAFTLIAPRHRLEIASLVITAKEFCDLYPFTPGTTCQVSTHQKVYPLTAPYDIKLLTIKVSPELFIVLHRTVIGFFYRTFIKCFPCHYARVIAYKWLCVNQCGIDV